MRAIKFKFWDEEEKKFYYGDLYDLKYGYLEHDILLPEFPVSQFTGLLDKNGKEIYEGDILSAPHFDNLVIGYSNDKAAFVGSKTNDFSINEIYNFVDDIIISEGWEIIGHIYETNILTPQTR